MVSVNGKLMPWTAKGHELMRHPSVDQACIVWVADAVATNVLALPLSLVGHEGSNL